MNRGLLAGTGGTGSSNVRGGLDEASAGGKIGKAGGSGLTAGNDALRLACLTCLEVSNKIDVGLLIVESAAKASIGDVSDSCGSRTTFCCLAQMTSAPHSTRLCDWFLEEEDEGGGVFCLRS